MALLSAELQDKIPRVSNGKRSFESHGMETLLFGSWLQFLSEENVNVLDFSGFCESLSDGSILCLAVKNFVSLLDIKCKEAEKIDKLLQNKQLRSDSFDSPKHKFILLKKCFKVLRIPSKLNFTEAMFQVQKPKHVFESLSALEYKLNSLRKPGLGEDLNPSVVSMNLRDTLMESEIMEHEQKKRLLKLLKYSVEPSKRNGHSRSRPRVKRKQTREKRHSRRYSMADATVISDLSDALKRINRYNTGETSVFLVEEEVSPRDEVDGQSLASSGTSISLYLDEVTEGDRASNYFFVSEKDHDARSSYFLVDSEDEEERVDDYSASEVVAPLKEFYSFDDQSLQRKLDVLLNDNTLDTLGVLTPESVSKEAFGNFRLDEMRKIILGLIDIEQGVLRHMRVLQKETRKVHDFEKQNPDVTIKDHVLTSIEEVEEESSGEKVEDIAELADVVNEKKQGGTFKKIKALMPFGKSKGVTEPDAELSVLEETVKPELVEKERTLSRETPEEKEEINNVLDILGADSSASVEA